MDELREFINNNFISHVAFDLRTLLDYLDEIYTDYQGEEELTDLITDETDTPIDKPEFVRTNIVVSCISLLEHYGVEVDPDIPVHTLVGVMKPLILFGNSAVRDIWYSIDTEQTDNEEAYVQVAKDVFDFVLDPMIYVVSVSDLLISTFTDEDELILPMINNGLHRNNLKAWLKKYPSKLGSSLLSTQVDTEIDIADYTKLYFPDGLEDDMVENDITQLVVDLMCISMFTSPKMRVVVANVETYIEDKYAGESIVVELHKTLNKITKRNRL